MGQLLVTISPAKEKVLHFKTVLPTRQPDDDVITRPSVVQIVQSEPTHDMTHVGHMILSLLFYGLLISYIVVSIFSYLHLPPMVSNDVQFAKNFAPIDIFLTPVCEVGPCGDIRLLVNYTELSNDQELRSNCGGTSQIRLLTSGERIHLQACPVKDPVFSVVTTQHLAVSGIVVSFTFPNATAETYASILIEGNEPHGVSGGQGGDRHEGTVGKLQRYLTIAPMMVKSFNMGISATSRDDVIEVYPYSKNFQMEGSRGDNQADTLILLASLANVKTIETTKSAVSLMAEFGNGFEVLKMIFVLVIPLFLLLFAAKQTVAMEAKSTQ